MGNYTFSNILFRFHLLFLKYPEAENSIYSLSETKKLYNNKLKLNYFHKRCNKILYYFLFLISVHGWGIASHPEGFSENTQPDHNMSSVGVLTEMQSTLAAE